MSENHTPRITLLGVGGAGCRIMRRIAAAEYSAQLKLLALDTDLASLEASGLPEADRIQVGKLWRGGHGCGGDAIAGQRAVAVDRAALESRLAGEELLVIVGGLGGGTCSGGVPVLLGIAAKLRLTTMLLLSLPFSMEGVRRQKLADDKIIADLLPMADALIALPNDLLFASLPAETPLAQAFEMADEAMARSAMALSAILGAGNLFSADLASFSAILKRRSALCSLGIGTAQIPAETPADALEKLLLSPLLGGAHELNRADAVVFTVLGGPELSLATAKETLELLSRQLPPDEERTMLLGAGTAPAWANTLQLTALAVRYLDQEPKSQKPEPQKPQRGKRPRHEASGESEFVQIELPSLVTIDKGIMENTPPVVLNGEDLDIPAFMRRGIVIDFGK